MADDLRTRLTDLIYGTVSWRDVNVPVAEEVADAVIKELKNDPSIMFMSHIWEALRKQNNTVNFDALADAVIRELGLQQEFSVGDDEGGRTLWLADEEPVTPREGEVVERRWISRWERDE